MFDDCVASGKEEINLLRCEQDCSVRHCGPECWNCYIQRSRSFVLKIDLLPRFVTDTCISWVLLSPARATFADLHLALQVTFGWANSYPYSFAVFKHDDKRALEDGVLGLEPRFKITNVPAAKAATASILNPMTRDSSKVKLHNVFNDPMPKGWTVHYNNDFNCGREHVISCIERRDPIVDFLCLSGEGHSWDMNRVNKVFGELGTSQDQDRAQIKAAVLLISLNKRKNFDEIYAKTITKLRAKAVLMEVTHLFSAILHLSKPQGTYNAVVVTDPTVTKDDFRELRRYLVSYIQAGGTAILGLDFDTADRNHLIAFLESGFGLHWETSLFNSSVRLRLCSMLLCYHTLQPNLSRTYVTFACDQINLPFKYKIFMTTPVSHSNTGIATAVFAEVGKGFLGYIGDGEPIVGSMELLVIMCGL